MKAIRVHQPGGPEALVLEDVAEPAPKPGEAIVEVTAAGLNFIDVYFRTGGYKAPMPMTLGMEASGTVVALGEGVTSVRIGDTVAYQGVNGAYAERAAVPAQRLVPVPAAVGAKRGAAAMIQGMTAHFLACSAWPLQPGQTCLVHAAAGGVGLLLCQIAKLRGARVIGTVSTEEKAELARDAGADDVILYTSQDFEAEAKRLTDGKGVNVIYDGIGKSTFEKGLQCLVPRGMMVLYGQASGPVADFNPQILNMRGSLFLTRPNLGHYVLTREELLARAGEVLGWVAEGKLRLRIEREYPLAEAAEAHRALEGRKTSGKILLVP
jgi:NADPH2:quinone reductase